MTSATVKCHFVRNKYKESEIPTALSVTTNNNNLQRSNRRRRNQTQQENSTIKVNGEFLPPDTHTVNENLQGEYHVKSKEILPGAKKGRLSFNDVAALVISLNEIQIYFYCNTEEAFIGDTKKLNQTFKASKDILLFKCIINCIIYSHKFKYKFLCMMPQYL